MNSFATYLKNVRSELSHVVWPSQRQTVAHVAVIAVISIITALLAAGLDYAFTKGIARFLGF
jgi:preprotein translocase SecE subunit